MFYRNSLSSGSEVITFRQEIEIVKNYIKIQNIRYNNIILTNYIIDKKVLDLMIPKLIIQPLIENSIYHGIRPKEDKGHIMVKSKIISDTLIIIVEDNGVGMDDNFIRKLYDKNMYIEENKSFGLIKTIERLRLFYNVEDIIDIDAVEGKGTKITIHIPMEKVKNDEKHIKDDDY